MGRKKNKSGSVFLRKDGRWEGRYVIGYDDKGLPKTKNVLAKTKTECLEKLAKLREEIGCPQSEKKPAKKFLYGEWIDRWYQTCCKQGLRQSVQRTYEERIYKQIIPRLGQIPLIDLTHGDVQHFLSELKKDGRLKGRERFGPGLSDSVVRSIFAHVQASLKRAIEDKLIKENPAADCLLPKKKSKEMRVLTHEELQRLMIQAKEEGFYELLLLDLATGLRRGELCALRWEDLDETTGELRIDKQVQMLHGETKLTVPKTNASVRTVILPKGVKEELLSYKETVDSPWMFPSPVKKDAPRDPTAVRKKLSKILEHAQCKHVRFHDLRHTFATLSLEYGMDVKTLSSVLGHRSVSVTLDTYSHVTSEMQEQAAGIIDRTIGKAEPDKQGAKKERLKTPPQNFEPYKGKIRKPGTGCISKITPVTWEGRYSPRLPNGKRDQHVVYAHSEEECEKLLAEMIKKVKEQRVS